MAKPEALTDDDLLALANHELRQAVGYFGGKLADQRKKAEQYYLGLPDGDLLPPEIDGRSSVVSTDVRNTIESMLPQLMAKFVGGDQVVEFEPAQKDDEQKATQCTDYLNYLFSKKNNGHAVCYSWFKDALLQKNGFIKVWWDTRTEEKREEYKGLTLPEPRFVDRVTIAFGVVMCVTHRDFVAGFGSRKVELVDKLGDPSALFTKARQFARYLPAEFRAGWTEAKHGYHLKLVFPETDSVMIGEGGDDEDWFPGVAVDVVGPDELLWGLP